MQDTCGEDLNRLSRLMFFGCAQTIPRPMRRLIIFQTVATVLCIFVWLRFNGGLVPWFLTSAPISHLASDKHLWEHFAEAKDDGSEVTWAHAVNSRKAVEQTLNGHYMMIEGDISLRGQNSDNQQLVPIMAQPPDIDSDLTFSEWLDLVSATNAGLKLDFKSIDAVEISLQRLKDIQHKLRVPIQLGADILVGPGSLASPPVDPGRFLRLCSTYFSQATLALGWSGGTSGGDSAYYYWTDVERMHDLLMKSDVKAERVTLMVRARWASASLGALQWLMEMTGASITLLAEPGESVTVADLLQVRARLPKRSVYYDIGGGELLQRFTALKENPPVETVAQFDADQWKVTGAAGQLVYLGTRAVMMRRGLLVSRQPTLTGLLYGRVHFFQPSCSLDVLVHVMQAGRPDSLSAVSCQVNGDGSVRIATKSIPGVDRAIDGRLPTSAADRPACLQFRIIDSVGNITLTVKRPVSCADDDTSKFTDVTTDNSVTVHFPMTDIVTDGRHIALRTDVDDSFVVVDRLVANFETPT